MPITIRLGRKPRRKAASIVHAENLRQLREHIAIPKIYLRCPHGVLLEQRVGPGESEYCSICNPQDRKAGRSRRWASIVLPFAGRIVYDVMPLEIDAPEPPRLHGAWEQFVETGILPPRWEYPEWWRYLGGRYNPDDPTTVRSEVSPGNRYDKNGRTTFFAPYLYGPELQWQRPRFKGSKKWFEQLASGTAYQIKWDGLRRDESGRQRATRLSYFDLAPKDRRDWQPPVVHKPIPDGPFDLLNANPNCDDLPHRAVDYRIKASQWWNRRRTHCAESVFMGFLRHMYGEGWSGRAYREEYSGWVDPRWTAKGAKPELIVFPKTRITSKVTDRVYEAHCIEAPPKKAIPRDGTKWAPPVHRRQPLQKPRRFVPVTVCPPMPASATYKYEVPQVRYRGGGVRTGISGQTLHYDAPYNGYDCGFYGDGHSESEENYGETLYP